MIRDTAAQIGSILADLEEEKRLGARDFFVGLSQAGETLPFGFVFAPEADYENWLAGYSQMFENAQLVA